MHQKIRRSLSLNNRITMFCVNIVLIVLVGFGIASGSKNGTETPRLRQSLHNPPAGIAPTTLEDALTVEMSTGGSHFQKLPGKWDYRELRELGMTKNLSIAAGAYELAGFAHIQFQFSLVTFLKALKAACLRMRNVKAHLQKAGMVELVAATGMWKYSCLLYTSDAADE